MIVAGNPSPAVLMGAEGDSWTPSGPSTPKVSYLQGLRRRTSVPPRGSREGFFFSVAARQLPYNPPSFGLARRLPFSRSPFPKRVKGNGGRAPDTPSPRRVLPTTHRFASPPGYLRNLRRPRTIALQPSGTDAFGTDFSAINCSDAAHGKVPFGPPLADMAVT